MKFIALLAIFVLAVVISCDACTHEDLFPNDKDCGSFYQCVNGVPYLMPCPNGLHWNNEEKICDWPENTTCNVVVAASAKTCKHGDLYPNPKECDSFYQCSNDHYYCLPCPHGLQWNDEKKYCDYPYLVKCDIENAETHHCGKEHPTEV